MSKRSKKAKSLLGAWCNFAHSSLVYQDHHLTQQEKHILGLERKFYKVHMGN